ncbi:uncharacterized protein LOC105261505 [Musca domestica]|uniref:Uncharacterized protein LOC105261505 n=1 Tax=Musca domestica TaxID=7370 RepID=A0A9J7D384_MUSDO|nr:uncharacterized protein LOC105261505 [Musca domestica]
MAPVVKGQEILMALEEIQEPANLTEVVEHLVENFGTPVENIMKKAQSALEAGVKYGYIEKENEFYFIPEDANEADGGNVEKNAVEAKAEQAKDTSDCYGNQRGMRRRQMGEKRRRRSRSRSARRSSRRRRR